MKKLLCFLVLFSFGYGGITYAANDLAELRSKIRFLTRDDGPSSNEYIHSDTELDLWINEAQTETLNRLEGFDMYMTQREQITTVIDQDEYELPSDLLEVKRVYIVDTESRNRTTDALSFDADVSTANYLVHASSVSLNGVLGTGTTQYDLTAAAYDTLGELKTVMNALGGLTVTLDTTTISEDLSSLALTVVNSTTALDGATWTRDRDITHTKLLYTDFRALDEGKVAAAWQIQEKSEPYLYYLHYTTFSINIGIYPVADNLHSGAKYLEVFYTPRIDDITVSNPPFNNIGYMYPYHKLLVDYAMYRATLSIEWLKVYEIGLDRLKKDLNTVPDRKGQLRIIRR